MRKLAFLSVAFALVAVSFYGCDEQTPTEPQSSVGPVATSPTFAVYLGHAGRISGGGHIREGDYDISLSGNVNNVIGERESAEGNWTIQFHNVSAGAVSGGTYHAESVYETHFYRASGSDVGCVAALGFSMLGTFNGEPNRTATVYIGDAGAPAGANDHDDTVRIVLYGPSGKMYDTADGDFTLTSSCAGVDRTDLDAGNFKIDLY